MLTRTPSMDAFEARYRWLVVLATTVGYGEEAVTPAAPLAAIKERFGVLPSEVSIEVACPLMTCGCCSQQRISARWCSNRR